MKPSIVPPSKPVLLSGPMGSGKSTVGPLLAAQLGFSFVDLDAAFETAQACSIAEYFTREGEASFRREEAALIRRLLSNGEPLVVALGGFTLGDRALRHELLERALIVTLDASPEARAARLGDDAARPLLAGADKLTRLTELAEARRAVYAEAHLRIDTEGREPEEITSEIAKHLALPRVAVLLGERSYCVHFAQSPDEAKAALIDAVIGLAPSSLLVITDSNVMRLRHAALDALLDAVLLPRNVVTLAPGEASKTLQSVAAIWDAALGARIDRDALVIAFGGGVVGDLAAFAASTLLRGVRFLQVPTTVLAMLDSSVGGKTGFDHAMGKNLIGSFWQPSSVIVDVAHAETLPPRELRAGLAEAVKMAITHDAALFAAIERQAEALAAGDHAALADVVRRGVAIKAGVVRRDETEQGERALLNLGHTLGHAIELDGGYRRWLHGEAVALGLAYELEASARMDLAPADLPGRVRALLARLGLPTELPAADLLRSLGHLRSDKKRRGKRVALAKLDRLGAATVTGVALDDLERTLRSIVA